jgi:hypothetical protein
MHPRLLLLSLVRTPNNQETPVKGQDSVRNLKKVFQPAPAQQRAPVVHPSSSGGVKNLAKMFASGAFNTKVAPSWDNKVDASQSVKELRKKFQH